MNIQEATKSYEDWLSQQIVLNKPDIEYKHEQMRLAAFPFFRATFYRWAQLWPKHCPALTEGPSVLAVGDLHVENFGTWRDTEGRLIWGVNDFDEACQLPYANDLVRLAVSADLAIQASRLQITSARACEVILAGYLASLKGGGEPFVLAERHTWLRRTAASDLRDPEGFWAKLDALPDCASPPPSAAVCLASLLPADASSPRRIVHRRAGEGSLGHARFTALGTYRGGSFAREVKALSPSAVWWAERRTGPQENLYGVILSRAVRCADPWFVAQGEWLIRRLAPDCSRVELSDLPSERDDAALLWSMGFETGNIHLGTAGAGKAVRTHLKKQKGSWLPVAMTAMTQAVQKDWEAYSGGKAKGH